MNRHFFLHWQTLISFHHFRQVASFSGSFRDLESHTSILQKLDLLIWETWFTSSQQRIQRGKGRKLKTVSSAGLDLWILHALEMDSYHASVRKTLKEVRQWAQIKNVLFVDTLHTSIPLKSLAVKVGPCLFLHVKILVLTIT